MKNSKRDTETESQSVGSTLSSSTVQERGKKKKKEEEKRFDHNKAEKDSGINKNISAQSQFCFLVCHRFFKLQEEFHCVGFFLVDCM